MRKLEMDMTKGPLFSKIVRFSIPLIIMMIIQLMFNAADVLVVGIFVDDVAVAAVGSNTSIINLIIGLFTGFSVSANVLVARFLGEGDENKVRKSVGLAIAVSLVAGVVLLIIGVTCARTFLVWMGCDPSVLDLAVKYLRIYFLGMPIIMLYNFCASILRAAGDTLRPLIFLIIGGAVNVGLNIFFVTVFNMDVDGVAIATVASQAVAVILSLRVLIKNQGMVKLKAKYIRFYKKEFLEMVKIGVPSGIQSSLISFANVLLQSSVNSLGQPAMSGYSYELQIANVVYVAMLAVAQTAMSFIGQNYGVKDIGRIKKTIVYSVLYVSGVGLFLGLIAGLLGPVFLRLITQDEEVLGYSKTILQLVCLPYLLCGIMDTLSHVLRALGKSFIPMAVVVIGILGFRAIWFATVFVKYPTMFCIFITYPISWILVNTTLFICLMFTLKKVEKSFAVKENINAEQEDKSQAKAS